MTWTSSSPSRSGADSRPVAPDMEAARLTGTGTTAQFMKVQTYNPQNGAAGGRNCVQCQPREVDIKQTSHVTAMPAAPCTGIKERALPAHTAISLLPSFPPSTPRASLATALWAVWVSSECRALSRTPSGSLCKTAVASCGHVATPRR